MNSLFIFYMFSSGLRKIKLLQNIICKLRKQVKGLRQEATKTPLQLTKSISKYVNRTVQTFIKGQILNGTKNVNARRYGVQERKFALALYYHNPKAYRFLSSIFSLPSSSSVHLWLRNISIQVGWSKQTLTVLRKRAGTHLFHGTIIQFFFKTDHDQRIRLALKLTYRHMCHDGF